MSAVANHEWQAGSDEETLGQGFYYDGVAAGREVRAGLSRRPAATRPLPMEDVCFFVKTIDNSRLVRVVDPHSRRECWGLVGVVSAAFVLALLYIGPALAMLRAGYRVQDLKREHEALVQEGRQLQVQEARLRDPQRIYGIARRLNLDAPAPEQVVWPEANGNIPNSRDMLARSAAANNRSSAR